MQVANTLNDNIRILFNPRLEAFKLFDFLMVKSVQDKYLAQIIEIYDDKFDSSQNVARIKLHYKITQNNEVMPYDNFTPNKECEIIKIKEDEIEQFLNQGKKTFEFGINPKNSMPLNVQYDFFDKNAIILADKVENACAISLNLAKSLSEQKNTIIIDSTGIIDFEGAKKIKASKHFKIPLTYDTIDFVFDKCLKDASLEFQNASLEILNEIKKFARSQEDGFIPFNAFTRVLLEQYKATPYIELKLLLQRIKKYQMDEIFARIKKDKDTLFNTIENNKITIVDLSGVDLSWQKAYLNYIVSELKDEVYLIARIMDENCDVDIINKMYCKKTNIKFVPNVSYNYKKLPSIMQYCKNYILMPSLYQRADFLNANFALCNLISDGCIIFGESTDNFLYLANKYEIEPPNSAEDKKNYRKIALSLVENDTKNNTEDLQIQNNALEENSTDDDSKRLINELTNYEEKRKINEETEQKQEDENALKAAQEVLDNLKGKEIYESYNENLNSADEFQNISDEKNNNLDIHSDDFQNLDELKDEFSIDETAENVSEQESTETPELNLEIQNNEEELNSVKEDIEDVQLTTLESENEPIEEEKTIQENQEERNIDLSDEELDFFEISDMNQPEKQDEPKDVGTNTKEEIDLDEIANNSINTSFEEIVNKKTEQNDSTFKFEDDTTISFDNIPSETEKENLPIFKEDNTQNSTESFAVGNIIFHKKYGRGTVVKTIKYEERQLLQIEFEESGKKLLDPKVADITIEQ